MIGIGLFSAAKVGIDEYEPPSRCNAATKLLLYSEAENED